MRERNEDAVALAPALAHRFAQRHLAPVPLDRELTDEQEDRRAHESELGSGAARPRRRHLQGQSYIFLPFFFLAAFFFLAGI